MTSTPADRLYQLLPAVYRLSDAGQGEPLRALLAIIAREFGAVEQDIAGLYENWFIETCQEWVVPYIGDLLGVRPLYPASPGTYSQRAYVAHTLDYRRRKGTAAMLEQLALDVTGWPARVVEFFQLLATTQYLNHLRPENVITPDLRDTNQLELLGGPFERIAHTADVRHIRDNRNRYNIPNIGIFLWRLQNYFIGPISTDAVHQAPRQSDARAAASPADGRYTFDPLGATAPIFNSPQTKTDATRLAGETNVPGPLRRRPLYDELEALRQSEVDGQPPATPVYFGSSPIFQVMAGGALIPPDQILICDISDISATDWRRPPAVKPYLPSGGGPAVNKPIALSADLVRGRIAFPAGVDPGPVEVSYTYAFSGDLGAGPYDRTGWINGAGTGPGPLANPQRWQAGVSRELAPIPSVLFPTLTQAVQAWNAQPKGTDGVIAILDSHTYQEDLTGSHQIGVPEGSRLLIVAADWPSLRETGLAQHKDLDPNGLRPHLLGAIAVASNAPASSQSPGQCFIDGLLIEGPLTVVSGNLGLLGLSHSTLAPGAGGLRAQSSGVAGGNNDGLVINLYRAICGPIALDTAPDVPTLNITDSVVSSGAASDSGAQGINAPGTGASIQTTTVFGTTDTMTLEAGNSIFTGAVTAERRQTGCVRFCYVPANSQVPRRYQCQPDLALTGVNDPAAQNAIRARLTPQFTSLDFGQPGYAQLSLRCAVEIATGAEDGSEMGAFSFLQQPQRLANLQIALEEYLRFGLEAGVIEQT